MPLLQKKLEFSKKLSYIDVISWIGISLVLLIASYITPNLNFIQGFDIVTKAYVVLRLGYTAKAGLENFKKITNSTSLNDSGNG